MGKKIEFVVAVSDITPPYPVWLGGYGNRQHKSTGVLEPISAGSMALRSNNEIVLFIALDVVGLRNDLCEELYGLIEKETGVGFPNIILSSSHTHFSGLLHEYMLDAPEPAEHQEKENEFKHSMSDIDKIGIIDPDQNFKDFFFKRVLEAVKQSLLSIRPGTVDWTRLDVPAIMYNRRTRKTCGNVVTNFRYPQDAENYVFSDYDSQLTVIRVSDDEGSIGAVMVNYGCHPVAGSSRDGAHYLISPDYPFYLRKTVSNAYNCPVLFTLGAAGDTVPVNRMGDSRELIGNILGNTAVLAEPKYQQIKRPEISVSVIEFEAETIVNTSQLTEDDYNRARSHILSLLQKDSVDLTSQKYREAYVDFNQKMRLALKHRLYPDNRHAIRIQFVKIGELIFVAIPFEVLSEFSLTIKKAFPQVVIISCAGGYQGYLPLEHEYSRGGYETRSTHFEKKTADRLLMKILAELEKLAEK